jgi:phosphate/sulfate permease
MAHLVTPIGILIAVAVMALCGAYGVMQAVTDHSVIGAIAGAAALVAAVGAALLKPWSRYLVYVLTAGIVGVWIYSLYVAGKAGYFTLYSPSQIVSQLAPGTFLVLLSCYCAYAVFRQFRVRTPKPEPAR